MADKVFRAGGIVLTTTTTTNLLNPGTTTGGTNSTAAPYDKTQIVVRKITVGNVTASTAKVCLFLGATGTNTAGKELPEFAGAASAGALTQGVVIPANGSIEKVGIWNLSTADFIVGGSDTASALTIMFEGFIAIGA